MKQSTWVWSSRQRRALWFGTVKTVLKVYFTDVSGHILHTYFDCTHPLHVASTSWGTSIIADASDADIKLFDEAGDFLGNVRDENGTLTNTHHIHIDEAERRLYISRGAVGKREATYYQ